jgi:hypothetical protein
VRATPLLSLSRVLLAGVALLASACDEPGPAPPDEPPPDDCDDVWGPAPADGRIYVDAAAAAGGDGSAEAPFADLFLAGAEVDSGLEAARQSGIRSVVLAAGEYPGAYRLSGGNPQWLDSGLQIVGCGADRTELVAIEEVPAGGTEPVLQANVDIYDDQTQDILLADLSLVGGRRGLLLRAAAGAAGAIIVERVEVVDTVRVGVVIDGVATRAHLVDVDVVDVAPDGAFGWGIAVQTGANPMNEVPAPNVFEGVRVLGATEVGILADGAWLDLTDVTVADTVPDALTGRLGRGIQLQNRTRGTLDAVTLQGNVDAALFLHKPGRQGEAIYVLDSVIRATDPADVAGEPTGDGLVLTDAGDEQLPEDFLAIIDGVQFSDNPRSHMLVEGVWVQVGPDNIFGKGTGFPFASQGGALVEGLDGGQPGVAPEELTGDDALLIDSQSLGLDDIAE